MPLRVWKDTEIKHRRETKQILNQVFDKATVTWKRATKKTTLTPEKLQFLPSWEVFNWNVIAEGCTKHWFLGGFSSGKQSLYSYLCPILILSTVQKNHWLIYPTIYYHSYYKYFFLNHQWYKSRDPFLQILPWQWKVFK